MVGVLQPVDVPTTRVPSQIFREGVNRREFAFDECAVVAFNLEKRLKRGARDRQRFLSVDHYGLINRDAGRNGD
jgi:hypothetical protein